MNKGKLIELCGIDGSGKTTIKNRLSEILDRDKYAFYSASDIEPFTTEIEKIAAISNKTRRELFPSELRSYIRNLDLIYIQQKFIVQNLDNNISVIMDRFLVSSQVYCNYTTNGANSLFPAIMSAVKKPDLVIFLEVDPQIAWNRICLRGERIDSHENILELSALNDAFKRFIPLHDNVVIINASKPCNEVLEDLIPFIKDL